MIYYFNLVQYFICKGFSYQQQTYISFYVITCVKAEIWSTNYVSNNFLFTLLVYGLMTVTLQQPKHVAAVYYCYTEVVQ